MDEKKNVDNQLNDDNTTKINEVETTETFEKEDILENTNKTISSAEVNASDNEKEYITEKSKKKITKGPIIAISSIVAIIALIIIISVVAISSNPKVKVAKALKATNNELISKEAFIKKVTGEDDFEVVYKNASSEEVEMNILSSDIPEINDIGGTGIKIESLIDNENKKAKFNFSGKYKNTSLGDLSFYTDNQKNMIKASSIYDSWFSFDCENIQDQFNNSIFGENQKVTDELTLKLFDDRENKILSYKEFNNVIIKAYLDSHKSELDKMYKNIKVEKLDKNKEIMVKGNNKSCKGYSVFIAKEDIDELLNSFYDYIENNEDVKEMLKPYTKTYGFEKSIGNKKISNSDDQLKDLIDSFRKSFVLDDVSMNVYIASGKAVGIDVDTTINWDNDNLGINLSTEYRGNDNLGDDIGIIMTLDDGTSKFDFDMNLQEINEGNTIKNILEGNVTNDGETIKINCSSNYNTDNKSLDGEFKLEDEEGESSLNYNGKYDFDKTSKNLTFDFDKMNVKFDVDNEIHNIVFDFSYNIEPLSEVIEEPDEESIEIFKIDKNKLFEIVIGMEENLNNLQQTLGI